MATGIRRDYAVSGPGTQTVRPLVMGREGIVSAGHYQATMAGYHVLRSGGTAIDAGVAAGIALNVVLFTHTNFGGVAPIALYHAATDTTMTIDGLGVWPKLADVRYFEEHHGGQLPEGIMRAVTPAAADSWLTALEKYGTLTLGEVLEPAWQLASGAPVSAVVAQHLRGWEPRLDELDPLARELFFPGDRALGPGQELVQDDLANLFRALMDEEAAARREGLDRAAAIRRARDVIYRSWVAEKIGRFYEERGGWLRASDLAEYRVELAEPLHGTYHGYDIFTCGPWCQGPMLIQFLNQLEYFDLDRMEHNSPEYLHVVAETMNLVFADRENFYGDPRLVDVPLKGLLSKEYARLRAQQLDPSRAFGQMPEPGNPWAFESGGQQRQVTPVDVSRYLSGEPQKRDTSYVACVDGQGNVFSATPSDPVFWTPMVPGVGFGVSGRGAQSRPHGGHPSSVAPKKRPRLTPNPALVGLEGRPFMGIGCPGGDVQTQGMLQTLLNIIHFGMNVQEAIEAPRLISHNFPNSFSPFTYHPGRLDVEESVPADVRRALEELGHKVRAANAWSPAASSVHAALVNPENGVLLGGADPRREGAAVGW